MLPQAGIVDSRHLAIGKPQAQTELSTAAFIDNSESVPAEEHPKLFPHYICAYLTVYLCICVL